MAKSPRHRTEAEIRRLVRAYRASGLSQREFAEQEGIAVSTLSYWNRKFPLEKSSAKLRRVDWVTPGPAGVAPSELNHEVRFPGDVVLHLARGTSREEIETIVGVFLERLCSR